MVFHMQLHAICNMTGPYFRISRTTSGNIFFVSLFNGMFLVCQVMGTLHCRDVDFNDFRCNIKKKMADSVDSYQTVQTCMFGDITVDARCYIHLMFTSCDAHLDVSQS